MESLLSIFAVCGFLLALCVCQPAPPPPPSHDMSCVVPTPPPVNNVTGNQLVTLIVKSPWFPDPEHDRIRETLFETLGDCGLDVFVLEKGWIFDSLIPVGFSNYCRKLDPSSKNDVPQVSVLSAGSLEGGIAPTLMPMPRRLPLHWRTGIIIWIHYNRVVAEQRPFDIVCNYPYNNILGGGINVVLNVNATLTVNGCPFRTYGALCDQKCDYCATGVNCNGFTGACLCPKGFYGATCNIAKQGVRVNADTAAGLYLPFGEIFNLTCTSHGFKASTGKWQKDGIPQRSVSRFENVDYSPRPLVVYTIIEAIDVWVDGVYKCEITDDMGQLYTDTVNVTVIGVPDAFVEFPFSQEVTEGSRVSFRCSVKELTGRIVWYRGPYSFPTNATELAPSARHRIINHSPWTSELIISDVRVQDDDVYKCFVGHIFTERDQVFAQAQLTVFVPTESRIVGFREGQILTQHEQTPLQLECRADNTKPPPRVTWFIGDTVRIQGVFTETILTEDRITYNITSRLNISPLWRHDTMAVRCVMENMAMGTVSHTSVVLDVTYAPKVKTPARVTVTEGEQILIECLASANPHVREYQWTIEHPQEPGIHSLSPSSMWNVTGEDNAPNANTDLSGQFDGNLYKIRKADERHNDMLVTCTVYNIFGSGSSETRVRVRSKPAAMAAPVVGIGIMSALSLLVLVVILQCFKRQIRACCASMCKTDEEEDKDYDVFICYKSGTEEEELYVVRILTPWLEERGFSVCIRYRHFTKDKGEDVNINEAISHSNKIILVLSPAFINSSWYQYDFRPSLDELNTLRQNDVIPIMYEDMTLTHSMDPALYHLLRNVSYIQWPSQDPEGCGSRELFWKLLRDSLPRVPIGEKGSGMAASDVSLPDMVGEEALRYNAEEESLWPLPPRRQKLFQSRRDSNNIPRRQREMIPPNNRSPARRHRVLQRQEGMRTHRELPSAMHDGSRNYRLHDPRRASEEELDLDMYDPNRVLII